jgi:cytochrome c oxidase cbb3-type subunit I/II
MMFYVVPMYWAGVTQGLMWKQFTSEGFMQYPNFLETVLQLFPMFRLRAIGGSLYILGALIMAYNLYKTAKQGQFVPDVEVQAPMLARRHAS